MEGVSLRLLDSKHKTSAYHAVVSTRYERVELVEEDDARARVARTLEHSPDVRLGLADVHVQELGAFDGEEVQGARRRDGFGDERLPGSRRSVEQNAWVACEWVTWR